MWLLFLILTCFPFFIADAMVFSELLKQLQQVTQEDTSIKKEYRAHKSPPIVTRSWSDASSWPDGTVPRLGDIVKIPIGDIVLLDDTPPSLGGLTIDGALVFDEQNLELTSDWIMIHGGLYIGSAQKPFAHKAIITLTGSRPSEKLLNTGMGDKTLGVVGGILELYGEMKGPSWTRLASTARAGDHSIELEDAGGWSKGDSIVVASTDYSTWEGEQGTPERRDAQVEEHIVQHVSDDTLTLSRPLKFEHYGEPQTFGSFTLHERAEVARLNRNIVIRGDGGTAIKSSDRYRFGGHVMALRDSRVRLSGVELTRMGQLGVLARYPIHFHLMGDTSQGSFVENSSIHHVFNRCLAIHGSGHVIARDNVAYDSYGHCYFLEDAIETNNVLERNLALMIRKPPEEKKLLFPIRMTSDRRPFGNKSQQRPHE
jgi:cell migration-inducing and hyaluronan-binding protein